MLVNTLACVVYVHVGHPQQLASSYFGPAEAERLRDAGDSGTERLSPTVRLEDSVLRVHVGQSQTSKFRTSREVN